MLFETLYDKRPTPDNPRSSEGDFARLPNGQIMFAYSFYHGGRDDHSPCNIGVLFSDDNGKTFSQTPVVLVKASDHNVNNVMSVSLLPMENGDVGVFYIVKRLDGTNDYVFRRTRDGKTATEAKSCVPPLSSLAYYVINNGRVLRTKSGRIIVPVAIHRNPGPDLRGFDGRAVNVFFYSDDDGESWQEAPAMLFPPQAAAKDKISLHERLQEPGIVELPSGALYIWARTDLHCQYESLSIDNLQNCTPAQPSRFSSPISPLSMRQNPATGEYFAVWNPIPLYNGRKFAPWTWGRTPLVFARSEDGSHFSDPIVLEDDETRGFCYVSLFFPDEKTLLLSYCYGGEEEGGPLTSMKIIRLAI